MRKKDMYIDYSKTKKKRRRNKRKGPGNFFLIILLIIIGILLGIGTYKLVGQGKIPLDFLFANEEDENGESIEENIEESFDESIDDEDTKDLVDNNHQDQLEEELENDNNVDFIEEESPEDIDEQDVSSNKVVSSNRTEKVKAKGIYVTGPVAGSDKINELIDLVKETELNSMVIDIKNDNGEITYKMEHDLVQEINAGTNYIKDIKGLIKELKEQDIYLIARIVAFKDPLLAENKPEYSLKNTDGSLFRDNAGLGWINPYDERVWDYLVEISLEAIKIGFDEIQFDYIRFSTDSGMKSVDFGPQADEKSKIQIINEFTQYAYEKLSPYAYVSADVYGAIIDSEIDQEIVGQDYLEIAKYLDYICPMIYPSHYSDGSYGIVYPDLEPYNLILASLQASKEVLSQVEEGTHIADVRPWLQDFTAPWIANYQKYGAQQIREQIEGVYDAGYEEWILWNGSNNYTRDGLYLE